MMTMKRKMTFWLKSWRKIGDSPARHFSLFVLLGSCWDGLASTLLSLVVSTCSDCSAHLYIFIFFLLAVTYNTVS